MEDRARVSRAASQARASGSGGEGQSSRSGKTWATVHIWGFPKIGAHFGSPYNKDHSILGSVLRPPIFANFHCGIGMVVTIMVPVWVLNIIMGFSEIPKGFN